MRPHPATFSALEKFTKGMRVSGSVAMPASSTRICRTSRFLSVAEAAHEHVHKMTLCCSSSYFRAFPRIFLYLYGMPSGHPGPPPHARTQFHGPSHSQVEVLLGEDLPFLQPGVKSLHFCGVGVGGLPDPVVQADAPGGGRPL